MHIVTNSMSVKNAVVDVSTKSSGSWRRLLPGAGKRSVSLSGSGSFEDSAAEGVVRALAFSSEAKNFQLSFGNGDEITGPFIVSSYQRSGDIDNEEKYSLSLESAGVVEYIQGS